MIKSILKWAQKVANPAEKKNVRIDEVATGSFDSLVMDEIDNDVP